MMWREHLSEIFCKLKNDPRSIRSFTAIDRSGRGKVLGHWNIRLLPRISQLTSLDYETGSPQPRNKKAKAKQSTNSSLEPLPWFTDAVVTTAFGCDEVLFLNMGRTKRLMTMVIVAKYLAPQRRQRLGQKIQRSERQQRLSKNSRSQLKALDPWASQNACRIRLSRSALEEVILHYIQPWDILTQGTARHRKPDMQDIDGLPLYLPCNAWL